jgi:hypothetical protein
MGLRFESELLGTAALESSSDDVHLSFELRRRDGRSYCIVNFIAPWLNATIFASVEEFDRLCEGLCRLKAIEAAVRIEAETHEVQVRSERKPEPPATAQNPMWLGLGWLKYIVRRFTHAELQIDKTLGSAELRQPDALISFRLRERDGSRHYIANFSAIDALGSITMNVSEFDDLLSQLGKLKSTAHNLEDSRG